MTDASASPSGSGIRRALVGQPLARCIVEYWLRHPQASDTAQGAREWWLGDEGGDTLTDRRVLEALHLLVACGVAEEVPGRFGQASSFRRALPAADLRALLVPEPGTPPHHG